MESTEQGAATQPSGDDNRLIELENQLKAAREEQLRLLAEMDNLRKRAARDVESARKFGTERLLGELLPVYDGLEAGLKSESADADKLREGLQLTLKMLNRVLDSHGLRMVNPVGEAFDPEHHQAMGTVDTTEHAPGTVVTVLQKGYRLNERLLRPALVSVAQEPSNG